MQRAVFYSWQSDIDGAFNRNLIQNSLERALKNIRNDKNEFINPVLDRDTLGIAGTPSIADSIFDKIKFSDVFVADISIINFNSGAEIRFTPNPNVLIELGYAISQLGWDSILLIQNTAFGGPEMLPFDLRGRRVITYECRDNTENKLEIKKFLQTKLEFALKTAMGSVVYEARPSAWETSLWWGKWVSDERGLARGGNIFIREVDTSGFLFDLEIFDGARAGSLTHYARVVSKDIAYARVKNGDSEDDGEIIFRREIFNGRRIMNIQETASCSYHRGAGISFSGDFVRKKDLLFDVGVFNELELARLYCISGKYFDAINECFQLLSEVENLDDFHGKVIVGGVRGLFTIMEAILISGLTGQLWVAYIDGDYVRYFTTQSKWKNTLPKTIENWRKRFEEKTVIFQNIVDVIPSDDRFSYE